MNAKRKHAITVIAQSEPLTFSLQIWHRDSLLAYYRYKKVAVQVQSDKGTQAQSLSSRRHDSR